MVTHMFLDIPYVTFFTAGNISEFWRNVRAILFVIMPILLVYVATVLGGDLISVVRGVFARPQVEKDLQERHGDYDIKIKD